MQNGSSKTGRGVTVNGTASTLKRQPRPKTASVREERGSCSSTASCPVFSGCDLNEEPVPRCLSSLSSPTLHGFTSTKSSISSLQGSLPSLKGSVSSLKSFPTSSVLQGSSLSLCSSSPSLRSSSPSLRSSSPSLRSSSEDDSWDTNSWSSGATCLLRSSIKQHSEEVFRVRAKSASQPGGTSDSETGYQNSDSCPGSESQEGEEQVALVRRDSGSSTASAASTHLEQKIEEKLKFSQFLNEVTCRVLKPECLQAFGAHVHQKEPLVSSSLQCLNQTPVSSSPPCSPWFASSRDSVCDSRDGSVHKWAKCMPSCKILDASKILRRTQEGSGTLGRTYLETDIDQVRREDEVSSTHPRDVENRTLPMSGESSHRRQCPVSKRSDGAPRPPYRSTSLPRPSAGNNPDSDEDDGGSSSVQEQKEDLRRRLGITTHKLHLLENEFKTTREFLETELRRAQEELDKFTEKLRRIQSSYAALQRINQDMEEKIHRTTQRYEEEKRSLSREIMELKKHLMEAQISIQKLRADNDLYRKDCNLAAQLLQCGKSPYRVHRLSELPVDLQERVSSHMEKQSVAFRHSGSDAVPTAVIGRVLEKPEPGRSCPVTRSPSPQEFPSNADKAQRHAAYKSSDLSCSDTALYCPADERRHERRIRGHTDCNPEDQSFPHSFSLHEDAFPFGSLPASIRHTSFSTALDDPAHVSSSSQQNLFTDWRDGDYEQKNPSYGKDHPGFPKSRHVSHGSPNGGSPAHGYGSRGNRSVPTGSWHQMSVEDVNSFFCSPEPFSFQERNFAVGPAKIKLGPLYSSFPEEEHAFQAHAPDPRFPASAGSSPALNPKISLNALKKGLMFRSVQDSSWFSKDKPSTTGGALRRDYADVSPSSSNESLDQRRDAPHYKRDPRKNSPQHRKFGNTGLSRKDSLNRAQLYGTLLN
ncbi:brain-enriched guanylate kinase-associated protein [Pimephales promelas]|uniref:brain-enriched guanylate kinase-associated protein n=1 Tax=Pimephales promelas TaxID=90988 RepID=UPI0019559A4D|nr:brain-enriched guanylate kinase-associated protein [Pimephales promelas]KAG1952292.1 brain-enriched guanylate kinase-associated protein [Pimephales promelas]